MEEGKIMARKKKNTNSIKLKEIIEEFDFNDDDEVIIHLYGNVDVITEVGNIDCKLLNKKIKLIQKNAGGTEYGYKLYRFILEK